MARVAVIGSGAWGTALAAHAARLEHNVRLWAREPQVVADIHDRHENVLFLPHLRLGSPPYPDPAARGAMLCLRLRTPGIGKRIERELAARGVLLDHREPDILRLAPVPLYNTYHDIWRLAVTLREVAA